MTDDGWTLGTLKEYIESRFKAQDEALKTALAAAEKAVLKAETATEKRFENVNEFRESLNDMATRMITASEAKAAIAAVTERADTAVSATRALIETNGQRLSKIEERRAATTDSRASLLAMVAIAISLLMAGLAVWSADRGFLTVNQPAAQGLIPK